MREYLPIIIGAAIVGGIFAILWWSGNLARLTTYVQETKEELKKCTWPTWDELKGSTVVVGLTGGRLFTGTPARRDTGARKLRAGPAILLDLTEFRRRVGAPDVAASAIAHNYPLVCSGGKPCRARCVRRKQPIIEGHSRPDSLPAQQQSAA